MKRTIVLAEYQPYRLPMSALPTIAAERLWRDYQPFVAIDFPTPKTADEWQLTAQGWVGMIPVTRELTLVLQPKVPIANLLGMVEVAYGLESFHLLAGQVMASTIPDLYDRLTRLLVERILAQIQRGLYRPTQLHEERTTYVRGRLQIRELIRQPLQVGVPCVYHEPSVDVIENRILYWTLHRILQGGLATDGTQALARRALRILQPVITLEPYRPIDCRGRRYTRLNHDYASLHALCAFFLEACGPSHLPGDVESVPFVVNMARLYEQFVAAWLQTHLSVTWQLQIQERHPLSGELHFAIDLVLYDREKGRPIAVLDTKYKRPDYGPDTADVAQIVAYAAAKGVADAILIYPQSLTAPLDTVVGGVRVRTLVFALDGNLDRAGQQFSEQLNRLSNRPGICPIPGLSARSTKDR